LPYEEFFTTVVPEQVCYVFVFAAAANLFTDKFHAKVMNSIAFNCQLPTETNSIAKATNSIIAN